MARPKFVYQITEYHDDAGRKVFGRVVVAGEVPEDFTRFFTTGTAQLKFGDSEGRKTATKQFLAGIAADSIEEAFELVESVMARRAEEVKRELMVEVAQLKRKIALPGPGAPVGPRPRPGPPPFGGKGPHRRR